MSKKKDKKPAVRDAGDTVSCEIGKPAKKTTIGGQALIEGVMMVGPSRTCIAVRKGDGTIHVEEIKQNEN